MSVHVNLFKCPKCGEAKGSEVKDSRKQTEWIRRRRHCNACGHRFTTREMVWNDDPEDSNTIKRQDALNLRALAIEIIRRTDSIAPTCESKNPVAGYTTG